MQLMLSSAAGVPAEQELFARRLLATLRGYDPREQLRRSDDVQRAIRKEAMGHKSLPCARTRLPRDEPVEVVHQ